MPIPPFREDGWLPEGHFVATWDEVADRFGGPTGSRRALLTARLLKLRDDLRRQDVSGIMVLDGSYISAKEEPGDFDVLLIGSADLQERKDREPTLSQLLDAQYAEANGFSLFYITESSPVREAMRGLWDYAKDQRRKGVLEVEI